MASNSVEVVGNLNTTLQAERGPSKSIWASCPVLSFIEDPSLGVHYFNDFTNLDGAGEASGMYTVGDTGVLFEGAAGEYGTIAITVNDTADDGGVVAMHSNPSISIANGGPEFWMEARLKIARWEAADDVGLFVGAMTAAAAATNVTAGGALADTNCFGWYQKETATIYPAFKKASDTVEEFTDAGVTTADDTYLKLGVHFDGTTMRWYANGALSAVATDLGSDPPKIGINEASLSTATNPAGLVASALYNPLIAFNNGAATANVGTIDWFRVAYRWE